MFENINKTGQRNKIVPGWMRTLFTLPFFLGGIVLMVYLGNIYNDFAKIQASWFDGKYYVVLNILITVLIYLLIVLISLLPGLLLTTIARTSFEKRKTYNSEEKVQKTGENRFE